MYHSMPDSGQRSPVKQLGAGLDDNVRRCSMIESGRIPAIFDERFASTIRNAQAGRASDLLQFPSKQLVVARADLIHGELDAGGPGIQNKDAPVHGHSLPHAPGADSQATIFTIEIDIDRTFSLTAAVSWSGPLYALKLQPARQQRKGQATASPQMQIARQSKDCRAI
jgi:hypothetical protein